MSTEVAAKVSGAIVSITAHVPEDAMSAGLLGTERVGHGVRIREDGLIATIGLSCTKPRTSGSARATPSCPASSSVTTSTAARARQALVAAARRPVPIGRALAHGRRRSHRREQRREKSRASTRASSRNRNSRAAGSTCSIEAVFTTPPHESWSGAALVDGEGRLCGLGSLVIQGFETRAGWCTVNMFVPIELLAPIVDEICLHGRRLSPPRPWLGMLVHDDQHDLTVVGVYRNCPADKAGLRPGDVIVGIDDEPVVGLANMFRRVWSLGSAGVDVPLNVLRNTEKMQLKVHSGDRAGFQRKGTLQ